MLHLPPKRAALLSANSAPRTKTDRYSIDLTARWLSVLKTLCLKEKRRRERMIAKNPDYEPLPGHFDKNKNMVRMMQDIIAIIDHAQPVNQPTNYDGDLKL